MGEVLKAVLLDALTPAQLFVAGSGIFEDHRRSKVKSRKSRSVILVILSCSLSPKVNLEVDVRVGPAISDPCSY